MHGHTLFARAIAALVLFLVAVGVAGALVTYSLGRTAPLKHTQGLSRITVAGVPVFVAIAETPDTRARGLGGTEALSSNQGMLFVFDRDDYYRMWMKDMWYALDILWVSEQGEIVHMEKNISPDTYPQSFTSTDPSRMVLELPAGFIDHYEVKLGQRVVVY
jgi:hypothetical protein